MASYLSESLVPKRQKITSVGEDVEKMEPSCTVGGHAHWCSHYRKRTVRKFLKKLKIEILYDPAIPPLGVYLKKTETTNPESYMHPCVSGSIIYQGQDLDASLHVC